MACICTAASSANWNPDAMDYIFGIIIGFYLGIGFRAAWDWLWR